MASKMPGAVRRPFIFSKREDVVALRAEMSVPATAFLTFRATR